MRATRAVARAQHAEGRERARQGRSRARQRGDSSAGSLTLATSTAWRRVSIGAARTSERAACSSIRSVNTSTSPRREPPTAQEGALEVRVLERRLQVEQRAHRPPPALAAGLQLAANARVEGDRADSGRRARPPRARRRWPRRARRRAASRARAVPPSAARRRSGRPRRGPARRGTGCSSAARAARSRAS